MSSSHYFQASRRRIKTRIGGRFHLFVRTWSGERCRMGKKTKKKQKTCIRGNNFGRSRRVMDFDWGASIVIVFCVISRAAVQMSVFTHKWSETSPLWTNTYLLFPEIIKKHFINVCCKRFSFWQASHFTLRCFISTKSQAKHNMYSNS